MDQMLVAVSGPVFPVIKAFEIVSRKALKNAMYCHLKSYSFTSSAVVLGNFLRFRDSGNILAPLVVQE